MSAARLAPLFTWRSAICQSGLPPTARHVALTLSLYMNERGGSAHPGAVRLAEDTGLHVATVREWLARLASDGWLVLVARGGQKGARRTANAYEAALPPDPLPLVHDDPSPARDSGRSEADDAVHDDGSSRTTGRPGCADPSSSPRSPLVLDDPISSRTLQELSSAAVPATRESAIAEHPRDDVWDALVAALGHEPSTRSERGAWHRAVKDLREAGATPVELRSRAGRWPSVYPGARLTAPALARHWGELAGPSSSAVARQRREDCSVCDSTGWVLSDDGEVFVACGSCRVLVEVS